MKLGIFLFDEDGNEYYTGDDIVSAGADKKAIYNALCEAGVYDESVPFDCLEFLLPHDDEGGTSIVMRIREEGTHDEDCSAGAHCSRETCREWYSVNLMTMVNIRSVEH